MDHSNKFDKATSTVNYSKADIMFGFAKETECENCGHSSEDVNDVA
jgi:hypothetical protein